MQANGGQLHEVEPAGIYTPLREASVSNDAAVPETHRVPTSGAASLSEASSVTREADYTAVIEALVIAALYALEAHVRDLKKRVAPLQERGAAGAENPAVTVDHQDTLPGNHHVFLR